MSLRMLFAEYSSKNGRMFHFSLNQGNLCIDLDGRPHAIIEDVTAEKFIYECERFMDSWDSANPK